MAYLAKLMRPERVIRIGVEWQAVLPRMDLRLEPIYDQFTSCV
jgi:hypothetical protein